MPLRSKIHADLSHVARKLDSVHVIRNIPAHRGVHEIENTMKQNAIIMRGDESIVAMQERSGNLTPLVVLAMRDELPHNQFLQSIIFAPYYAFSKILARKDRSFDLSEPSEILNILKGDGKESGTAFTVVGRLLRDEFGRLCLRTKRTENGLSWIIVFH